jgi:hypothetical protein
MAIPTIAIVNESTVVTDATLAPIVAALQKQVSNDFAPVWGVDAKVILVPKATKIDPAYWVLAILDDSDQAGALGYHDITAAGMPLGKVFARADIQNGSSLSVTISHELLEILADPFIQNVVLVEQTRQGAHLHKDLIVALEVCDACEDDKYGYQIDGVLVSDFVHPKWFDAFSTPAGKYDQCGYLADPLRLLPGGYIGVINWTTSAQWTQVTAEMAVHRKGNSPPHGSRRERRRARAGWKVSTAV